MKAHIEYLEACTSTNELLSRSESEENGLVICARTQTAGRGQRGNSWEAEPGKNLTFSMLLRPRNIAAARQFELSMLVSLGIVAALGEAGVEARIKWPNDIYAGDRKLCGILIENSISGGRIERSIAGVGLNVNQTRFLSDAPNPVSIKNITGRDTQLEPLLESVCSKILDELAAYEASPDAGRLKERYRSLLWRGDGVAYPFRDAATGEEFLAAIADVAPDGTLSLRGASDEAPIRHYLFKEVEFLLK